MTLREYFDLSRHQLVLISIHCIRVFVKPFACFIKQRPFYLVYMMIALSFQTETQVRNYSCLTNRICNHLSWLFCHILIYIYLFFTYVKYFFISLYMACGFQHFMWYPSISGSLFGKIFNSRDVQWHPSFSSPHYFC